MPVHRQFQFAHRTRKAVLTTILIAGFLVAAPVNAVQCKHAPVNDRPKIGLALGGGGARGGAHIGVLKVLEEMRIPVDYIAGTSMGSIVGGLLATGMTSEEIEAAISEADWADLFEDSTEREDQPLRRKNDDELGFYIPAIGVGENNELLPSGAIAGQKIVFLFENMTSQRVQVTDFNQLPIPYRAVSADIVTGDVVIIDEGDISVAMRASMSVPGVFDPMHWEDHLLVDGGIVRNLPIDVVRDMGADVVIAVNVGTPPATREELGNLIAIFGQMSSLMINKNTQQQIEEMQQGDILITPDLGDFSAADFEHVGETIPIGFEAANAKRGELQGMSVSEQQYRAWKKGVDDCVTGPPRVDFVRLNNQSRFSDEILMQKIKIRPGDSLDLEQLDSDIRQIYALGFIRHARYHIVEENGEQGVAIEVLPDARGSDFIQSGLEITSDDRSSEFNIKLGYLKTDLNDRGAEVRTAIQIGEDVGFLGELYYPIDKRLRWIFRPQVNYSRREVRIYDQAGAVISEWDIDEYGGRVGFGREFGRHVGLFAGVRGYVGQSKVGIGLPGSSDFRYKGGEWYLSARYDRLDDRFFPSEGSYASLVYINSDENLGADAKYEQVGFTWFTSRTWDRNNIFLGTRFNTTLDDNAPVYSLFTGGGFLNMSGFHPNQLVGQHFGASVLGYRYQITQSGLIPGYAGMTVEYGNAAQKSSDVYSDGILNGSFFISYKTPIGPIYAGVGWSEDHSGLIFLRMGTLLGNQTIGSR
jgi:NTE family protein